MNKSKFQIPIGSSSLLLIFIVITLISFAVLSLSQTITDRSLAEKTYQKEASYYEACNKAQEKLKEIDEQFYQTYLNTDNENDFLQQCGENISFCIPVTKTSNLAVSVSSHYPADSDSSLYTITQWQLVYTAQPDDTQTLPVMP